MGTLSHLVKDGCLLVNESMRTLVPHVYAIGDVTGGIQLAHAAGAQGTIGAECIMAGGSRYQSKVIPGVIYTNPEMAFVGLTEQEVQKQGIEYVVGKFPLAASGRALTLGDRTGFVKILATKNYGGILGVHVVGPDASNLISEAALATS